MRIKDTNFYSFSKLRNFTTEYYWGLGSDLFVRNFLMKLFNDAIEIGYKNIDKSLELSMMSDLITIRTKSLTEILLNATEEFTVVTTYNYNLIFKDQPLVFTGDEKIVGYIFKNTLVDPKYTVRFKIDNVFFIAYLNFLFNLKFLALGNMEGNVNLANKPIVKLYIDNMSAGAIQEELTKKTKNFEKFLFEENQDALGYMRDRDSIELLMPSFAYHEQLIERINKEISQTTGLSQSYVEGKIVGGLGNNDTDRIQNEKVFSRINKVVFLPILNYIQKTILGKEANITQKHNGLVDFEKNKALTDILPMLESSELLSDEEKRNIIENYI